MEKPNKIMKEFIYDLIRDVKDVAKEWGKTKMYEEIFREYYDVNDFVKPKEKTITIYVSKYCPHCEDFLESPAFPIVLRKAKEKGFEVVISRLNDEKSLEKAMEYGLTNIPVAIVKTEKEEKVLTVDRIIEYLEAVKHG